MIDQVLDFTTIPKDLIMHQLLMNIKQEFGTLNMLKRIKSLVALLTTRDGVIIPTEAKLLSACRDLYFRSKLNERMDKPNEILLDRNGIFEWFDTQVEWVYRWHTGEPIDLIRDRVQFLAWYVLLIQAERSGVHPSISSLLDTTYNVITGRYRKKRLK